MYKFSFLTVLCVSALVAADSSATKLNAGTYDSSASLSKRSVQSIAPLSLSPDAPPDVTSGGEL
jgi:hypothetical protein